MKNKFFTTIFILFVSILAAIAGWLYLFSKISLERKEISELRKNILRNDKKNINEKSLARLLESVKNEKKAVEAIFLKEDDLVRLIKGWE